MSDLKEIKRRLVSVKPGVRQITSNGVIVGEDRVMNINTKSETNIHGTHITGVSLDVDAAEREFYANAHEDMMTLLSFLEELVGQISLEDEQDVTIVASDTVEGEIPVLNVDADGVLDTSVEEEVEEATEAPAKEASSKKRRSRR